MSKTQSPAGPSVVQELEETIAQQANQIKALSRRQGLFEKELREVWDYTDVNIADILIEGSTDA